MPGAARRSLNFKWPADDVTKLRFAHLQARRVYRQPAPSDLNLTLSAFTETAYRVARTRMRRWQDAVPVARDQPSAVSHRETLTITWNTDVASQLDDDWDQLAERATSQMPTSSSLASRPARPQVLKSDVARVGILDALEDWPAWVRSCPNDLRRAAD